MKSKSVVGENYVTFMAELRSGDEDLCRHIGRVPKDRRVTRHENTRLEVGLDYWKPNLIVKILSVIQRGNPFLPTLTDPLHFELQGLALIA